jgi:signal peptidase II
MNVKKFYLLALIIVLFDQATKYLVLYFKPAINLGLLKINFVKNTGAGFGILKDQTGILLLISFIVALSIIFFYSKIPKDKFSQVFFSLFLAGTVGNLLDRLILRYVIDFIDFGFWPAFNIADSAISIAAVGLIIFYIYEEYEEFLMKRSKKKKN